MASLRHYYNNRSVYWGDALKDALRAYYWNEEDVEVLDTEVTGVEEGWEEEELEEWEEEDWDEEEEEREE
jgi:hypothetical protein